MNDSTKHEKEDLTNAYVRDYYNSFLEKHPNSYSDSRWFSSDAARFDYEQTKRALLAALGKDTYGRVLEIGPGDGAWTPYIAKQAGSLTLLEQSEQMKSRVEKLISEKSLTNITIIQGSFPMDAPQETYDLIVSVRAFEYFEDKARAIATIANLLMPGARAVIITKNPHYFALNGKPIRTLHADQISPRSFKKIARVSGLEVVAAYPATLRWMARIAFCRFIFDVIHKVVVILKTDIVAPFFARYASESYIYELRKPLG